VSLFNCILTSTCCCLFPWQLPIWLRWDRILVQLFFFVLSRGTLWDLWKFLQGIILELYIILEFTPSIVSEVLIYISIMPKDVHFFMYLIATWIFSSDNCLFNWFANLLTSLFVLLLLNFCAICILWILILYLLNIWQSIPFCVLVFDSGNCFFWCTKTVLNYAVTFVNSCSCLLEIGVLVRK
jgi:hypothetical protein